MSSMADLTRNFGWIAWSLTVIGWFLSPIINSLVNKVFAYLVFDAPKKLKELENEIIRKLEQMLSEVEEQTVLRAAQDKGSPSDLKRLDNMKMDLKSALYEAEDILDLLDYRRIEKDLHFGDDASVWVENQLGAASAWIASCKGSWFGRWINVIRAGVMKGALSSFTRLGQFLIQRWQHSRQNFDLFSIRRAKNVAGAAVLQRPCPESRSSVLVGADPTCRPAEKMVDGDEIVEETQVEEGEAEEIQDGEEGEKSKEIEEERCEGEEGKLEEEIKDNVEGNGREATSLSILRFCARSLLNWFATACSYRDSPYGIIGIKSDKKEVESLVGITERISLKNRMKRIEDILNTYKTSELLNANNSSSGTTKDTYKVSNKEQKEIDNMLSRMIVQKVFGRYQDCKHISKMLRDGAKALDGADADAAASSSTSKPYSMIGIYGITGSGKTTLAKYVCHYEKGAGHFNPIMFIHVGKTLKVPDIFRNMLEQIKQSQPSEDKDLRSLRKELEEELRGKDLESLKRESTDNLKGKRFLLVLDDIWVNDDNQNGWDILLGTLNAARSGSRVLVTAQKADAAGALGAHLQQFPIPDLEEEVYLSLFMYHAGPFAADDDYGKYERIGRKIANRLHRSPIVAVTVAKQLQRNKSISFWETTANLDVLDKTMGALWWSYQQLGVDIRRCFAYCSIFPRGYELERDELVHIWIAQGFVKTRSNATEELVDVGHRYIDELLTFSFLQEERKYLPFMKEIFTIHDLLHELAERVCGSEFYRIGLKNGSPIDIPRGVHHLFVETNNGAEIIENIADMENLRTLIINKPFGWRRKTMDCSKTMKGNHDLEKVLDRLFMRLTKLRVLILILKFDIQRLSVPASIDHMKHLRYLGFGHVLVNLTLPRTFSKLYHIQTVDIPGGARVSYPEDMDNLIFLRHISCLQSFPNIGRLTLLQTIEEFCVKESEAYGLKQLKYLNKLRGTLCIMDLRFARGKEDALEAHLTHKDLLRKLKLIFGWVLKNRAPPNVEAEVLEGLCPPKHLEELEIWDYKGSTYPTWMLSSQHPDTPKQLQKLMLINCSQLASIPQDNELFIGLRELQIHYCDWDRLPQNMERLVALQRLVTSCCNKMELLPTLPEALKNIEISRCDMLRSIGIVDCPRLVFVYEQVKRLEAYKTLEYSQDSKPTGTPEQSLYSMILCPCLVTLMITECANLIILLNLPPSLEKLRIDNCGKLRSVSGQLGGLKELDISDCNKLESVDSLEDASSLETLFLSSCQCLTSLGPSGGPGSYSALRRVEIENCPAVDINHFHKNGLDDVVQKGISHALSSNPDERPRTGHDKTMMGSQSSMQMNGDIWVLDCSARMHYTSNVQLLDGTESLSSLRDDDPAGPEILRRGSVRSKRFEVPDVRYVKGDASRNVISVAQLARSHGLITVFEPTCGYVMDLATGQEVGRARQRDGLYVLEHLLVICQPQDVGGASLPARTSTEELLGGVPEMNPELPDKGSWFGMSRRGRAKDHIVVDDFPMPSPYDEQQHRTRTKEFYMDSSLCHHMTWNGDVLKAYNDTLQIKPPVESVIGSGNIPSDTMLDCEVSHPLKVEGIGYIDSKGGSLDRVLYVPGSDVNLVSVSQLTTDCSVRVVFHLDEFWIVKLESKERIGLGKWVGNNYVLAVLDVGAASDWVLKSSDSIHHTSNRKMLYDFQETAEDVQLEGVDHLKILGQGSVRTERLKVPGIRFTAGDERNVISVVQLANDHGLVTIFEPKYCYVKDKSTGQNVGQGHLRDGVYVLETLRINQDKGGGSGLPHQLLGEPTQVAKDEALTGLDSHSEQGHDSYESQQQPGITGTVDDKTMMTSRLAMHPDHEEWVLDTRASSHRTSNQRLLRGGSDLEETSMDMPPTSVDGGPPLNLRRGLVRTKKFEVPDVSYVDGEEARNVISVAQLASSHGLVTVFEPTRCYVKDKKTGQIVGNGDVRDDGVYVLDNLLIRQYKEGRPHSEDKGERKVNDSDTGGKLSGGGGTSMIRHDKKGQAGVEENGNHSGCGADNGRGGGGDRDSDGEQGGDRGGEKEEGDEEEEEEEDDEDEDQEEEEEEEERGGDEEIKRQKGHQQSSYEGLISHPPYESFCPCGKNALLILSGACEECRLRPPEASEKYTYTVPVQCGSSQRSMDFIMDSGAGCHMTWNGDNNFLEKYGPMFRAPIPAVNGFDGSSLPVDGWGQVRTPAMLLRDVLHVPGATVNLVSLSKLADQYCARVVFERQFFLIQKLGTKEMIGNGHRMSAHYIIDYFLPDDSCWRRPVQQIQPTIFVPS